MRPVETASSNTRLELPGGGPENALPAERISILPPYFDQETATADETAAATTPGFETVWEPDDGERKALANGAPVILHVWGPQHPPVNVQVGDPGPDADRLIAWSHALKALGMFHAALTDRLRDAEHGKALGCAQGIASMHAFLAAWEVAVEETRPAGSVKTEPDGDGA